MPRVVIVGLGNPGPRYVETRHNLGAMVLRSWLPDVAWKTESALHSAVAHLPPVPDGYVTEGILLYPQGGMNRSGEAVAAALAHFSLTPQELLVLHDDIELPLGAVRYKSSGSAAGHNGVRSIQAVLDTVAFARLRLGVDRPADATAVHDYVLQKFTATEEAALAELMQTAHEWLTHYVAAGPRAA